MGSSQSATRNRSVSAASRQQPQPAQPPQNRTSLSLWSSRRTEDPYSNIVLPKGCAWDLRLLKKTLSSKKIAPLVKGEEEEGECDPEHGPFWEECPICFLYFNCGLNKSTCCRKGLCTDCYLQIRKTPQTVAPCPFCNQEPWSVGFFGSISPEEKNKELEEEKRVKDLEEKIRKEELERDRKREEERRQKQLEMQKAPKPPAQEPVVPKSSVPSHDAVSKKRQPSSSTLNQSSWQNDEQYMRTIHQFLEKNQGKNFEDLELELALQLSLQDKH